MRGEQLRQFIQTGTGTSFIWGACDCCLWVCDWIKETRGVDPAVTLRGTYASEAECAALLTARGGLPALVDELTAAAGLMVTTSPVAGDIALVETRIGPALILITGRPEDGQGRYLGAWKSRGGVFFAPFAIVKAWAV